MLKKYCAFAIILAVITLCLSSCGPCYKATKLRKKADKATGAEQHRLRGQAASLEAACLKKRDKKYENEMQRKFEEMEKQAPH
jgi:hypothetical protein